MPSFQLEPVMSIIRPFAGLRPAPSYVDDVVAPPYDIVNTEEARLLAQDRPWSFLHMTKPEIDLSPKIDPYDKAVYKKSVDNFSAMLHAGILQEEQYPCFYLYRLTAGEHVQTGLVASTSVEAYRQGRIRKHELTKPQKEDDRVNLTLALNAQISPVILTYHYDDNIEAVFHEILHRTPLYDVLDHQQVQHTLWQIPEPQTIEQLIEAFESLSYLYIADGHHRCATADRVAKMLGQDNIEHLSNTFLSVLFPMNELNILPYNRLINDLNQFSRETFVELVAKDFDIELQPQPYQPIQSMHYGMYLKDQWYKLQPKQTFQKLSDPIASLDVSLLHKYIIEPILGIQDPRTDKRMHCIGGVKGLQALQERVDSGDMAVAFSMYPTSIEQLTRVADHHLVMPPKSTWFEPKLADGLISYRY